MEKEKQNETEEEVCKECNGTGMVEHGEYDEVYTRKCMCQYE